MRSIIMAMMVSVALLFANSCNNSTKKKEAQKYVTELTTSDFLAKVYNYYEYPNKWKFEGDLPVIIDFYANWCGPCKKLAPLLDELGREYDGKIRIYKVDVDKETDLAGAFGIESVPTLLFVPMGRHPERVEGFLYKKQLKEKIDQDLLQAN